MRVMNHRWWKYLNIDGDNAELKAPMGLLDNRHRPSWRAGGGRWSRNVGHTPSYTPSPPPGCFLKHSCFILILIASAYGFVGKSSSAMAEGWRREVEQERRSHSILHAEAPSWYRKKRPGHARKQRAGRSMKLSGHATGVVFLTSCAAWEKMSALLYCKLLMAGLWCTGSLRRFRVSLMLYSGRGRPKRLCVLETCSVQFVGLHKICLKISAVLAARPVASTQQGCIVVILAVCYACPFSSVLITRSGWLLQLSLHGTSAQSSCKMEHSVSNYYFLFLL
ncbi:uncharacterized protein LOC124682076 isoform X1 [Lolium rigidum]|uniref:uncharacterized protein LOC124682076 isoform X1 n=1 Tax=Lolium rigidum TaxID=89674 RepID=UPI001F5C9212|nr:uncharacterized protein LOC124682076 isoform X1 [Lolium rigidum]XP_047072786.1 uncharacterized protein LOC124682076 isoform X1 [Lolium rigidum]XP_047072787.1 uncharacterized protein LOC124682076 isoform X1 [Lolium rigidum]XP_047072788.1 uncharacterized protein LOC124682076 isoform X1 [Lolium rigidum]XP_047072789.1 uncharacterized protein LOC124682076 isoform X1 [Lolium rigidum]XP_047072790.1 uncharacterized protein LOC124682076 isoform X1 [Lolium rigidum]XP_047072791.1 uncharacterized prot